MYFFNRKTDKPLKHLKNYDLVLIMGKPGSSKSSYAAYLSQKYMKKGYPVFSNFHISGTYKINPYQLGEIDLPDDSIVFCDESQILWDSRDFKRFPEPNKFFFSHYRHLRTKCFVMSQSFEDLDVKIRRQAKHLYIMQGIYFFGIAVRQKVRMKFGISDTEDSIITRYKSRIFDFRFNWVRPAWKLFNSYSKPVMPKLELEKW